MKPYLLPGVAFTCALIVPAGNLQPVYAIGAPVMEARATELLRNMSDTLQTAKQLRFQAEITYDEVLSSGQKLQYTASFNASVKRPDHLRTNYQGDFRTTGLWYDGKNVTLLDADRKLYATAPAPSEIDGLLERIVEDFGFSIPVADLLYSDPFSVLTKKVTSGQYLGTHAVDGVHTYHLAFTQETVDWQLWIEEGARPLPRKITITYKGLPGSPQYTALLSDWDLSPDLPDPLFTFEPPAGTDRIDFLPATKAEKVR